MNITDHPGFSVEQRRNYFLPLNVSYETIAARYNQNTKRNIRKSKPAISIIKTFSVADYMNLKRNFPGVEDDKGFQKSINIIISTSFRRQQGVIYSAYSSENELCAAAYFLFDPKRVSYLNAVSSDIGKEFCAGHAIVDQFIQDNAQKNILLDFEGSQNHGVARFYEGFGAECEHYQHLYRNTLIWPLRIFKK
jgi:lipid II:glycine glycyltransferase (peptidoglycan interpeptide bridge formation enzyme)